jgi:DNA-binding transcriptional MerR regulator
MPNAVDKSFTRKEVSKLLNINQQSIAFYTNQEIVIPEVANPKGTGKVRRYSRNNLFQFLILKELALNGVTQKKIKKIITYLKNNPVKDWESRKHKEWKDIVEFFYDESNFKEIDPYNADSAKEYNILLCLYDIYKSDYNIHVWVHLKGPIGERRAAIQHELIINPTYFYNSLLMINITKLYERAKNI